MKLQTERNTVRNSIIIFLICLGVHIFEVLFIRTDETFFAECFINKAFGILLLYAVLKILKWHWSDIGFQKQKLLINVFKGFGLCVVFYSIAFITEFAVLAARDTPAHMEFFVTGFSLTGSTVKHTGFGFILMCIGFNIINVWMEEGLFRGFFITYIGREHSKNILRRYCLDFGILLRRSGAFWTVK